MLIDAELAREQFAGLDAATRAALAAAVQGDFATWGDRLVAAGNEAERARARHALKGLAGNFGAQRLLALADLADPAAFLACRDATVAAILNFAQ